MHEFTYSGHHIGVAKMAKAAQRLLCWSIMLYDIRCPERVSDTAVSRVGHLRCRVVQLCVRQHVTT